MTQDTVEDEIIKVVKNYAPHHDELRAGDAAWYAMGAICNILGIKTGNYENELVDSEGNALYVDDECSFEEDDRPHGHRGEDFHSDG